MTSGARVYVGSVVHKRLRPKPHALKYRVYSALLDLDRLDETSARLRFFSRNKFNLLSFYDRDHGPGVRAPIADHARQVFKNAGLESASHRILLLSYPRVLGYVFNPISVYFGLNADGCLEALIYEVNNTFGERTSYVVRAGPEHDGVYAHAAAKEMFVSPFAEGTGHYSFRVTRPNDHAGDELVLAVNYRDRVGPLIKTHFRAVSEQLTDRTILVLFARTPLLTFKVIAAIHYEAFKLWWKGVPLADRHVSPAYSISSLEVLKQG